ncbi:hypothetical protein P280DRAFT_296628 [Massarina eburnea CBS 473.64]|uniref:Uncharacterized protein n=1 Tax=Massarina eburnea CBS 473.64 TaxID=1395130 RepID=A0A6A6S2V2_9PLEO|nr:hypothetical protein P280DRAFT_296628 [Massarina eburnea CBS 473.64]
MASKFATTSYQPVHQTAGPGAQLDQNVQINPCESDESSTPSEYSKENHPISRSEQPCKWSVGLKTPALMILGVILAALLAVAHYLYCRFLDQKFVQDTIPQSWNNGISIAFARVFSTTLAASASPAFTQALWWFLRRKPLALNKIDAFFQLNSSRVNLYQLGLLRAVPVLWFFGLLFVLIPVATIFPPGSLVVQQLPLTQNTTAQVPILDVDYRGNGSAIELFENAMFLSGPDGDYQSPTLRYSRLGMLTLLDGAFVTQSSPCGANCTYDISFQGPSLRCEDADKNVDLDSKVFNNLNASLSQSQGFNSQFSLSSANFMAAPYNPTSDLIEFAISFMDQQSNALRNVTCITMSATYDAHVEYVNGAQKVTAQTSKEEPINGTILNKSPFYDVIQSKPWSSPIRFSPTGYSIHSDDELNDAFHGAQLRSISDTLLGAIKGGISSYGNNEGSFIGNTIIQDTPFATPIYNTTAMDYTHIYFTLSPSILEDLMKNVTISTLNDATSSTTTSVTSTIYLTAYVFKNPYRLIAAYAAALAVCLPFIAFGFAAMLHNGVAASSGGFFQILCTTTASGSLT